MRKNYDDVYQKERNLRREMTSYLRESRTRLLQIPEEPPQPLRWTAKAEEPGRREEIRQVAGVPPTRRSEEEPSMVKIRLLRALAGYR